MKLELFQLNLFCIYWKINHKSLIEIVCQENVGFECPICHK